MSDEVMEQLNRPEVTLFLQLFGQMVGFHRLRHTDERPGAARSRRELETKAQHRELRVLEKAVFNLSQHR